MAENSEDAAGEQTDLTPRQQLLLKEYEVCERNQEAIATRAWQLTAGLGVIVLGGVWAVFQSDKSGKGSLGVVLLSFAAIFLVWMWMVILNRHVRNQRIIFHRMHEIEEILHLRAGRHVQLMDHLVKQKDCGNMVPDDDMTANAMWQHMSEYEKERARELWCSLEKMRKGLLAFDCPGRIFGSNMFEGRIAMNLMGYLGMAGWSGLILREMLAVFSRSGLIPGILLLIVTLLVLILFVLLLILLATLVNYGRSRAS
ncbi:MAG: hypothetical protein HYX92_12585 [Chloroflexi bacterium]|nr:hypothetical protein [Chloroflexota bacterium]